MDQVAVKRFGQAHGTIEIGGVDPAIQAPDGKVGQHQRTVTGIMLAFRDGG